jgi:hypothetical protein
MTAAALAETQASTSIKNRPDANRPILYAAGRTALGILAGTIIKTAGGTYAFDADTPLALGALEPGRDYGVGLTDDGKPYAALAATPDPIADGWFAGFHFAPGGNATGKTGGDREPSINPFTLWDIDFRPACRDARGMALVTLVGGWRVWVDIYLLGVDHLAHGTSHCGAVIADGLDRPQSPDGDGTVKKLDFAAAKAIYTHHGKRLLGAEEFFAAAYGVKERCSHDKEPKLTGALTDEGERFISRHGLFDATGTMWQWGTDGHPDDPRPSIFGGSWIDGGAGSRFAYLDTWPEDSNECIGARGACDHLSPA